MADIVSKINIGTSYAIRSGYSYYAEASYLNASNTLYRYTVTVLDSDGNPIGISGYNTGLTMLVKFIDAPTRDTVQFKFDGLTTLKRVYYGKSGTTSPMHEISAGDIYLVFYDGTCFRVISENFHRGSNVISETSTGTSNVTSDTVNGNTYINHVENGTVVSSIQVVGSGITTVSGNNGVLTIESVGGEGSSTDEKLTVATYIGTNYKQVVLHDGVGTNDIGYGSDNLKFHVSEVTTSSGGGHDVTKRYDELVIGKVTTDGQTINQNIGAIKLGAGHGNANSEVYGIIYSPSSGQYANSLPSSSGQLLSSGGLLSDGAVSVSTGVVQNSTYYQCLYRGGKIFSAGVGGDQGSNDYPEIATWSIGDESGPTLVLGSISKNYPGLSTSSPIPSASQSQSGIVTTGEQFFSGEKTFDGPLKIQTDIPYIGTPSSSLITLSYNTDVTGSWTHEDNRFYEINTIPVITQQNADDPSVRSSYYLPSPFFGSTYYNYTEHHPKWANVVGTIGIILNEEATEPNFNYTDFTYPLYIITMGASSNRHNQFLQKRVKAPMEDHTYLNGYLHWNIGAAGINVFANSSISTKNETVPQSSNCVYLNHIDIQYDFVDAANNYEPHGMLMGTNIIQGGGITKVSAQNGVLTITTPDVEFEKGDFNTIGALIGIIGTSTNAKPISVQPARPDFEDGKASFYTRQGVIKPMFETRNAVSEFHGNTYGGIIDNKIISIESQCLAARGFFNVSKCKYIAIPIITDYWYNSDTQRYESVPYVLLPQTLIDSENGNIAACYDTAQFTGDTGSEPSISTITHYPFDKTYQGNLVDDRLTQNNVINI